MPIVSVLILAAVLNESEPAIADASTGPTEYEIAILEGRRRIRNGSFLLECTTKSDDAQTLVSVRCTFDLDHRDSRRFDWTQPAPIVRNADGEVVAVVSNDGRSVDRIVRTADQRLHYSPDVHSDGEAVAASVGPTGGEDVDPQAPRIFDPRTLGLNPGSFGHIATHAMDSFVGRSDPSRAQSTIRRERLAERECLVVEYHIGEAAFRMWFSADDPRLLVRSAIEAPFQDKVLIDSIDCESVYLPEVELWFPRRIQGKRMHGDELLFEEEIVISEVTLNSGVDPRDFTLAGLDLRPGTHVFDWSSANAVTEEWDGAKLVPIRAREIGETIEPRAMSRRLKLFIGVNLLFIAGLILLYYRRSRSRWGSSS